MLDVIIIGAGPAGAACAYDLAAAGCSVLILDRYGFPRKKACAGGITPKAMHLYPYDISDFVLQVCREVRVRRPGGRVFSVADAQPLCYMTRRQDLDAHALEKAVEAGGRFRRIDRILSLDQDRGGVTLDILQDGGSMQYRARYIVGADGANSTVRRLAARGKLPVARCPALEADVRVDRPGDVPMEFDFSMGIDGYYWIFPKDDHVSIGIFGARPGVPMNRRLLAAYARQRLGNDRLEAVKGYPIGVGGGRASAGRGRVLLAGDAAGFAEPLFGEGIYFALKSGRLAAGAILEKGSGSSPLAMYRGRLRRMILDLQLHRLGAGLLYRFPRLSFHLGSLPSIHTHFSRGYARGKTISQIFTSR